MLGYVGGEDEVSGALATLAMVFLQRAWMGRGQDARLARLMSLSTWVYKEAQNHLKYTAMSAYMPALIMLQLEGKTVNPKQPPVG